MTSFSRLLLAFVLLTVTPLLPAAPSLTAPIINTVTDATPLPVEVEANDPNIAYIGRFDRSGNPIASWSASTVLLRFHGTALNAKLRDVTGRNFWEVEVDGQPIAKIPLGIGDHLYSLASKLAVGYHTVRLVKATEAAQGPTEFLGFELDEEGGLQPPPAPSVYHLEVIGDSISCGYGNEGTPGVDTPNNVTENAYDTYGAITARKFNADYVCVAWSGHKMWPDNTMPELYDRIVPTNPKSLWDFTKFIPDAIVINLSTNEFGKKYPPENPFDQAGWVSAYEQFIARLRSHYPNAEIYCASSPMLTGEKLTASKACLTQIAAELTAKGDGKVQYLELPTQDPKDGIGGMHHPNVKTNQVMADLIASHLITDLSWKPVAATPTP